MAWLTKLGLGQYSRIFDENGVDASVLPQLTADDLKDMGVVLVGHRRKLLDGQVEADLRRALEIAREQEAPMLQLRAARDLAQLLAGRGERQQVFDLLAPIHGWFTEGFDTLDLTESKALLDEL